MKIEKSSTTGLLPGDICVLRPACEAEYRVRHIDDGEVWLSPLQAGPDVIVPASECRRTRDGLKERMGRAASDDQHADVATSSTPTFPDGTLWP